jgi:hypothetical protein
VYQYDNLTMVSSSNICRFDFLHYIIIVKNNNKMNN